MAMHRLIQAVIFDLDGVLVRTDELHYQAWKRLAQEQGWKFDRRINAACRGVPRVASLEIILRHNRVELSDEEKHALAERKNNYYKELLQTLDKRALYPGAVELLQQLRIRRVKLAVCSSSKNAAEVLRRLKLTPYFDAIVTGDDITHAKPHPEIFLRAAERLHVHPFHCVVFEDAASGVEAAFEAGMKCIGVGNARTLPLSLIHI
ncbi:MAG: beta-phosphoglucomutase, partial [bacterium]|nr:beta-phosphoglucomutase [bacterium]